MSLSGASTGSIETPSMDVEDVKTALKRKFIGVNGEDLGENKRARNGNVVKKPKCYAIQYIMLMALELCEHFKKDRKILLNVIESTQIMNICYRIHQYCRMIKNTSEGTNSTRAQKMKANMQNFTLCGANVSLTTEEMIKYFESSYGKVKDKYSGPKDFFAETHSVVCLMALFQCRLKELQVGPENFVARKTNGETVQHAVERFGIPNQYRHFCSGISWDVGIRNTLGQHTSALCQLLLLSTYRNPDQKFASKHIAAAWRSLNFIPQINIILDRIRDNQAADNIGLISHLSHIVALHGDKSKRRCAIPLCVFFTIGSTLATAVNGTEVSLSMEVLEAAGFSSKKAAVMYNRIGGQSPIADGTKFAQLVFHAYFGTQGEDFGILKNITNHMTWMTRGNVGSLWKGMKDKSEHSWSPVKLKHYSKNISSSTNDMLARSGRVMGTYEVFSGFRKKRFTEDFLKFTKETTGQASVIGDGTHSSMLQYLQSIRSFLIKKVENGEALNSGTVEWRSVEGASFTPGENGELSGIVPEEEGICFWSS